MQIDCGSDAPVTIGRHVVDLLEVFADKEGHQRVKMTTAGDIPVEADVVIRDLIVDGNLGAPLLKSWIITLDLANERLWISQKSDASEGKGGDLSAS